MIATIIAVLVVGYAIYFICGYISNQEKIRKIREQEETAQRAYESNQKYQEWVNELEGFNQSINNDLGFGVDFDPGDRFDQLWKLGEIRYENRYVETFETALANIEDSYRSAISEILPHLQGLYSLPTVLSLLKCLRALYKNDEKFNPAIDALKHFIEYTERETYLIDLSEYGTCNFKFNNMTDFAKFDKETEALKQKMTEMIAVMHQDLGKYYEKIPQIFTPEYIDLACELLWRTAVRKPFNQEYFKLTRGFFGAYTIRCLVDNRYVLNKYAAECKKNGVKERVIRAEKVEYWLAFIYAKNQIGGYHTVAQEKENILQWVTDMAYLQKQEECFILASGLAWLELYELEKDVLRCLVSAKVNLSIALQDRLAFLENGGNTNFTIYDVKEYDDIFHYDSSSIDWNKEAFDVFFRKLEMSRRKLNYSLAISKWTKSLPVPRGVAFDADALYKALLGLKDDFENDNLTLERKIPKAINLADMEQETAYVFHFDGKRNKCISVLLICDKYGRNINLEFITLFTPEEGISYELLKKYALAIKDNIYMESFREAVLQEVDEITKENKTVKDESGDEEMKVFG